MENDTNRPRLVIDTNVFVSGLISRAGSPARVLDAIRHKKVAHLVSDPVIEEYLRVLDYPRIRKFKRVTDMFVADIAAYLVFGTERVELVSNIAESPDPDDDVFLTTAVDGKATLLISGDKKDLLSLGAVRGISVMNATDALARLNIEEI